MQLTKRKGRAVPILVSALLGAAAFILIYGYRIIIPTYTDWLMFGSGDPQQHYLGWRFFQQSAWYFPIGMMDNLGYPIMTSVVYTDSIPLFAVIFKLLTPVLPADFQYFGIWGLLCFVLQGALGAVICLRYARSHLQAILGSLLFILSPAVLNRMYYHSALAGHWIILFGLALVAYHESLSEKPIRAGLLWGLLGGLIASVHLYFLPMCGILCLGYCLYATIKKRRLSGLVPMVSFAGCMLLVSQVLGVFASSTIASSGGLGEYSFNLNGLFNPLWESCSAILRTLPTAFGQQYEGFSYLGFGALLLCVLSAFLLVDSVQKTHADRALRVAARNRRLDLAVYGIMALLCVVAAASPVVTFGEHVLFRIPLPEKIQELWAIFRSSGRLIWPLGYILIFVAIATLTRRQSKRFAALLLACCVGLQVYDLHGRLQDLHREYSTPVEYENPLTESFWLGLGEDGGIEHLVVDGSGIEMYPLADIALQNHWTLSNFYFARSVDGLWNTLGDALQTPDDTMLFAIRQETYENIAAIASPSILFYKTDGLVVGTTRDDLISLPELETSYHYPIGDGAYLRGGEDVDGVRYIHPEGLSYGPYWHLRPGIYEFHMAGSNLDQAEVVCAMDGANTRLQSYDYRATESELTFKIQIFEEVKDLEILVSTATADTISFTTLTAAFFSENNEILADDPARSYRPFAYSYAFADNVNLEGGNDRNGVRYVNENGISYGPYLNVPAGEYEVRITGVNLNLGELDCVTDGGSTVFELLNLQTTQAEATFRVELDSYTTGLEVRIRNHSEETIALTSLTIESIAP